MASWRLALLQHVAWAGVLSKSLAHDLNNDAFRAAAVEFRVIDLLPWTEIELPLGHGHDHLVVDQQALQMLIAIGLSGAVMTIILAVGGEAFEPFIDVGQ